MLSRRARHATGAVLGPAQDQHNCMSRRRCRALEKVVKMERTRMMLMIGKQRAAAETSLLVSNPKYRESAIQGSSSAELGERCMCEVCACVRACVSPVVLAVLYAWCETCFWCWSLSGLQPPEKRKATGTKGRVKRVRVLV